VSAAITLTIVMPSPGVPAVQDGDGSSALLVWMSPTWQLWREAPTYVAGVTRASSIRLLLWLLGCAAVAWLFARRRAASEGGTALAAAVATVVVFVAIATASAAIVPDASKRFDVEGRALFPMLETLDPIRAPDRHSLRRVFTRQPRRAARVVQAICRSRSADRSPACPGRLERAVSTAGGQVSARSQGR
jgi:hypothetical protein